MKLRFAPTSNQSPFVPAEAGTQGPRAPPKSWVPASAGTNGIRRHSNSAHLPLAPSAAEHRATSRAKIDAVAAQAVSGATFVRNVLAAEPVGVLLAGGALRRRALRSRWRCWGRQRETEEEAAGRRHRGRAPMSR